MYTGHLPLLLNSEQGLRKGTERMNTVNIGESMEVWGYGIRSNTHASNEKASNGNVPSSTLCIP